MSAQPEPPVRRLWVRRVMPVVNRGVAQLDALQPLAQVAARGFLAQAFFLSGLTKLRDWDSTLALFSDEYHVPLLSPEVAAHLGTGGELVLPVLLALGLFGRFAAAGLMVVNAVAVLSLSDIAPAALQQHQFWGSLLLGLLLWGPGRWSLDALLLRRWMPLSDVDSDLDPDPDPARVTVRRRPD